MNVLDLDDTIRLYLLDNISDLAPISFENEEFTKPEDLPWITYTFKQNVGKGQTLGNKGDRRFKRLGMIFFQVFTPLYTSVYDGSLLCQKLVNLFEGERIGEAWFYSGLSNPTGPSGEWYQFNVSIEFRVDETK